MLCGGYDSRDTCTSALARGDCIILAAGTAGQCSALPWGSLTLTCNGPPAPVPASEWSTMPYMAGCMLAVSSVAIALRVRRYLRLRRSDDAQPLIQTPRDAVVNGRQATPAVVPPPVYKLTDDAPPRSGGPLPPSYSQASLPSYQTAVASSNSSSRRGGLAYR